jgi:hypothetical protein
VRMISPLAKGEQMAEVENIVRFVEMLRVMGGQQGEQLVALEMDIPAATGRLGDLMNVPLDVRNDKTKKTEIQQGVAAQAVQEQGGSPEQAQQAAATVEDLEARRQA